VSPVTHILRHGCHSEYVNADVQNPFYLIHYIESKKRRLAHRGRRVAVVEGEPTQVPRTSTLRSSRVEQPRSAVTRSCTSLLLLAFGAGGQLNFAFLNLLCPAILGSRGWVNSALSAASITRDAFFAWLASGGENVR
jgi:hypothetical protein